MWSKVAFVVLAVVVQFGKISTQRQWVLPTTTAAEMRNPYTWYWPYAIAAAEGYREYYQNAQQITNQLYTQAYATNAFWWTNNRPNGGGAGGAATGGTGQAGQATGGATGQAGQTTGGTTGGATGQAGQATGQTGNQGGNTGQGGAGWGK